jgi:hypothetical protein
MINYQLYAEYTDIHKPGASVDAEGFSTITVRTANNRVLYSYLVAAFH